MGTKTGILDFTLALDNKYILNGKRDEGVCLFANIKAGKAKEKIKRSPLNLSLVIDRSGSMADRNKLDYVKEACKLIIDNLSPSDYVSIVAYSTDIEVVSKSAPVADKHALKKLIDSLYPTNATNLSGGMLEGYAQVKSTYDKKRVNRVLLLSDGLANTGVCDVSDLQQIVKDKYKKEKIAISTFGVGADFNEDLMTNIAEYGKGNYYFIDASDKIPAIFRQELQGLLSVVAQNVKICVTRAKGFKLDKVFGYEYKMDGKDITIDFNDVFAEEEKPLLMRFKLKSEFSKETHFKACLSYDDVNDGYKRINECLEVTISLVNDGELFKAGENEEAVKNRVLMTANEKFEAAVKAVDNRDYETAKTILKENEEYLTQFGDIVAQSPELTEQMASNSEYESGLDDMSQQTEEDFRMTQKMTKSRSYLLKKKRKSIL